MSDNEQESNDPVFPPIPMETIDGCTWTDIDALKQWAIAAQKEILRLREIVHVLGWKPLVDRSMNEFRQLPPAIHVLPSDPSLGHSMGLSHNHPMHTRVTSLTSSANLPEAPDTAQLAEQYSAPDPNPISEPQNASEQPQSRVQGNWYVLRDTRRGKTRCLIINSGGYEIATVNHNHHEFDENANMLAASRKMLAALLRIEHIANKRPAGGSMEVPPDAIDDVRNAIAEATGEI